MTTTVTLSVRLNPRTRRVLAEAAAIHGAADASALARDILERWAGQTATAQRRESIERQRRSDARTDRGRVSAKGFAPIRTPIISCTDATFEEVAMSEIHRITVDANQCGGRPCLRHLRIRVKDILELLAAGAAREEILEDYPLLEAEDITAALEYAASQSDHPVLRIA